MIFYFALFGVCKIIKELYLTQFLISFPNPILIFHSFEFPARFPTNNPQKGLNLVISGFFGVLEILAVGWIHPGAWVLKNLFFAFRRVNTSLIN